MERNADSRVMRRRVAMVMKPVTDGKEVVTAFRGATREMVEAMAGFLHRVLCEKVIVRLNAMPRMDNGKCSEEWQVVAMDADIERLSPKEWSPMIKRLMEAVWPCEVTIYDDYEEFVNL